MPTRLSEILAVTREQLEEKGVYDSMIDYDSRLHIDPALLSRCKIPEFRNASKKISNYFNDVLKLLKASKKKDDIFWRQARKKLSFGEGLNTGLGYSEKGINGSGIGPKMAENIITTVKDIITAGTSDPAIFELVPVFEERIGADRISDMTSLILKEEFSAFTTRVAEELEIEIPTDHRGKKFVFLPRDLLSNLPISEQWEDVEVATAYNEEVRESLNKLIGVSWKTLAAEVSKNDLKALLVENPTLVQELIELYKKRTGREYDFVLDHLGIMLWDVVGHEAAASNPLHFKKISKVTSDNVLDVVAIICNQFKKLVEHNGLVEHIYDSNGDRRPERFPQLLFYAVADSYCTANELDLNREINAGSGALDFKVSDGLAKVNVELKYSSNPKLVEGFEKQLPTYNRAEGIEDQHSIYLVLRVNKNNDHKLENIRQNIKQRELEGLPSPRFIVVDAIKQPSASKR